MPYTRDTKDFIGFRIIQALPLFLESVQDTIHHN